MTEVLERRLFPLTKIIPYEYVKKCFEIRN